MKNALILACMILFSFSVFSQQLTPNTRYERLMKKSKNKQIGGFIFLGAGAAATAGGIYLIKDGINKQNNDADYNTNYTGLSKGETEQVLGAFLTGIGIGGMCTSIPFFVGAHRAHKKAMAISLKTEGVSLLYKASFSKQYYPVLALQVPLGR